MPEFSSHISRYSSRSKIALCDEATQVCKSDKTHPYFTNSNGVSPSEHSISIKSDLSQKARTQHVYSLTPPVDLRNQPNRVKLIDSLGAA